MSLEAIVRHYVRHYRPHSEAELDWFRSQPSLADAITHAANAEDSSGRRFSHQYRIRQVALDAACAKLQSHAGELERQGHFGRAHERIAGLLSPISGLGELYVYDTSLRIGAHLRKLPTAVYLHAGARIGACSLRLLDSPRMLFKSEMPEALQVLEAHEIEDVLCIYKDVLGSALDGKPIDLPDNDWCYRDDPQDYDVHAQRRPPIGRGCRQLS